MWHRENVTNVKRTMSTKKQRQSQAAKKAWRSRRRMLAARGIQTGIERVMSATTPFKTSATIGKELGVSPAYVRKCWSERGLKKRAPGRPPKGSALSSEAADA